MSRTIVSEHVDRASRWIYQGLWAILVRWFRVPDRPPELPMVSGDHSESFRPAAGFLSYLKFKFWVGLTLFDGVVVIVWFVIAVASPLAGMLTAPPALAIAVLPGILAYIAIHLRYDTTWYVMTARSLRIRRGIWIIHETTITFENVQNVEVRQGPLQRLFGIADVLVQTAGGGGKQPSGQHGAETMTEHHGLIEGTSHAPEIRDQILVRLRHSRAAGLGDEPHHVPAGAGWSPEHIAVLREIRDLACRTG